VALFSALGHEALMGAMRGSSPVLQVPLDTLHDDQELRFLVSSAKNLELDVELLDLSEPDPAAPKILLARAADPSGAPYWAVGSDARWRRSASDALRDLIGQIQLARDLGDGGAPDVGDPLISEFDPWTLPVTGGSVPALAAATSGELVLRRLQSMQRRALAVPGTPADLRQRGLAVLRVMLAGRTAS